MIKLNESSSGNSYVGDQLKCSQTNFCCISAYEKSKQSTPIQIIKMKLFYRRDQYLVAMQLIFMEKDKIVENKIDNSLYLYTNPKILGPTNFSIRDYDDIELNFAKNEEISMIKLVYKNDAIVKMTIETIFGQYVQFGEEIEGDNETQWDFYSNDLNFDGFNIGWDENKINYLEIFVLKERREYVEEQKEKQSKLKNVTNEISIINANPLYLSEIYGTITKETNFNDDLEKFGIFEEIKKGEMYLNEISLYFDGKKITRIDTEYTNKITDIKRRNKHITENHKDNNKKMCLQITKDDFIKYFIITTNTKGNISSIYFETADKKELNWPPGNEEKRIINNEKEKEAKKLLGLVVGKTDYIKSLQFYFEKQ